MKWSSPILLAGLLSVAPLSFAADKTASDRLDPKKIELAHYAKAFVGQGNVTVEVAPYKKGDQPGAILLFKGIEGPWDGQAINHEVKPAPYEGTAYVTTYKGEPWTTLRSRKDEQGNLRYSLYVPGVNDEMALVPSDGGAQLTTPQAILEEYLHHYPGPTPKSSGK